MQQEPPVELDLSTFVLEIVNFLVLVWILKRFLYRPVLDAIERRKTAVAKTLSGAEAKEAAARDLEAQYRNRLGEWEHEKQQLRSQLDDEIAARRDRMLAGVEAAAGKEREKEKVLAARRLDELRQRAEKEGAAIAARFASRLLERVADPGLEQRLIGLVIEDLPRLPEAEREALEAAGSDPRAGLRVTTAFPVPQSGRTALLDAVKAVIHRDLTAAFAEDRALIAGVRIDVGPWIVRANLRDELAFFSEKMGSGMAGVERIGNVSGKH
ncbi:MAG: hypothetical protein R2762_16940 [Bryobacteraceae bacterium]